MDSSKLRNKQLFWRFQSHGHKLAPSQVQYESTFLFSRSQGFEGRSLALRLCHSFSKLRCILPTNLHSSWWIWQRTSMNKGPEHPSETKGWVSWYHWWQMAPTSLRSWFIYDNPLLKTHRFWEVHVGCCAIEIEGKLETVHLFRLSDSSESHASTARGCWKIGGKNRWVVKIVDVSCLVYEHEWYVSPLWEDII